MVPKVNLRKIEGMCSVTYDAAIVLVGRPIYIEYHEKAKIGSNPIR